MSRNMKEYTQKKNHTVADNVTKGLIEKTTTYSCMKEYTQERNHTVANNAIKNTCRRKTILLHTT